MVCPEDFLFDEVDAPVLPEVENRIESEKHFHEENGIVGIRGDRLFIDAAGVFSFEVPPVEDGIVVVKTSLEKEGKKPEEF
jgi:hypothetical protein